MKNTLLFSVFAFRMPVLEDIDEVSEFLDVLGKDCANYVQLNWSKIMQL